MAKHRSAGESVARGTTHSFRQAISGTFRDVIRETARVLDQQCKAYGQNEEPYHAFPIMELVAGVRELAIMLEFCGQPEWARRLEKKMRDLSASNRLYMRALDKEPTWGMELFDSDMQGRCISRSNAHSVAYEEVSRSGTDLMETVGTMANLFLGDEQRDSGLADCRRHLEAWRKAKEAGEERFNVVIRNALRRKGKRPKRRPPGEPGEGFRQWGKVPADLGRELLARLRRRGDGDAPDDLITTDVAVRDCGISKKTLRRAVDAGKIQDYRPEGAATNTPMLLSRAEVERFWPRQR